jgi:type IV pilus assembly protein PilB
MDKVKTGKALPPIEQLRGRTLGRILIKMGVLTREKVHECLIIQKQRHGGVQIGQIFIELGLIDEKQLQTALAAQRGMEFVKLSDIEVPPDVIEKVPQQMVKTYRIVPIEYNKEQNELVIALDNADNFRATDDLSTLTGFRVTARMTDSEALESALAKYYEGEEEKEAINELIDEIQQDSYLAEFAGRDQSIDLDELKELSESNPVKKLLNLVLLQAIRDKSSDIHFEPFENEYRMNTRCVTVLTVCFTRWFLLRNTSLRHLALV